MTKMDNLDRILRTEDELAPSSGFAASVMDRVREEAAVPKPIPFPWQRVLPGGVAALAGVVWMGIEVAKAGFTGPSDLSALAHYNPLRNGTATPLLESAGWMAAALGVSLLSWLLARRMVGRKGLI